MYETRLPDEHGNLVDYPVTVPLNRDSVIKELNFGFSTFDTIQESYLTVFQCTTLEGWAKIMMMIQDVYSIYTASFFFLLLVIVCSYFLLNLTVAVMLANFKLLNQDITDKILLKYEKNQLRVQMLKQLNSGMDLKS